MKKLKLVSWHRQADRASWVDCEEYKTPYTTAEARTRKSATADDDVLRSLVFQYEEALKEGKNQREALEKVWSVAVKAKEMGMWPEETVQIIWWAFEAGELAHKALNPVLDVLNNYEARLLARGINAAQELVKANPVVLRLPFIQEVMMYILKERKYGQKPSDMRALWGGFLARRHGLEKLTGSPESYRRLVKKAKDDGVKVDSDDDTAEGLAAVAYRLGVSESKLTKYTADKTRGRGRPPKK